MCGMPGMPSSLVLSSIPSLSHCRFQFQVSWFTSHTADEVSLSEESLWILMRSRASTKASSVIPSSVIAMARVQRLCGGRDDDAGLSGDVKSNSRRRSGEVEAGLEEGSDSGSSSSVNLAIEGTDQG